MGEARIDQVGALAFLGLHAAGEDGKCVFGLLRAGEDKWRILVLTAFREDVALKLEELTAWFTASRWDEQAATELTNRFYADVALVSEYEEVERQTA